MGFFTTTKKLEEKSPEGDVAPAAAVPPASFTRVSGSPPAEAQMPRYGIDHAIQLMRSLPTDKNVDLVITVLKTTLESLNIRVVDIVQDAARRQHDIEGRVSALKGEIAALENEMEQRLKEIMRLEAAHTETTRVKDHLESGAAVVSDVSERATVVNDSKDAVPRER